MKKLILGLIVLVLAAFTIFKSYNDGRYHGVSRSIYTSEPYYGNTTITIENGKITGVDFFVRDSSNHELFDDKYERHFAGNDLYVQQCRNDLKGIRSYPDSLIKYQDLDRVDAISGATWSYNIFKASAEEALKKAGKKK